MSLARLLSQMRTEAEPVRWFGLRLTLAAVFVGLACVAFGVWLVIFASWVWGWVT